MAGTSGHDGQVGCLEPKPKVRVACSRSDARTRGERQEAWCALRKRELHLVAIQTGNRRFRSSGFELDFPAGERRGDVDNVQDIHAAFIHKSAIHSPAKVQ